MLWVTDFCQTDQKVAIHRLWVKKRAISFSTLVAMYLRKQHIQVSSRTTSRGVVVFTTL